MEDGAYLVALHDIAPGVRVAAIWSGGPYVNVHAVDGSGIGPGLDAWNVWDCYFDAPKIPPTLEAFREFVSRRLDDRAVASALVELVADALDRDAYGEPRGLLSASLN
jgi:hypothetical protein